MKNYIFVRNKTYRPSSYYRVCQYLYDNDANIVEYEPNLFYSINKDNKFKVKIYNIFLQLIPGYCRRINSIVKILYKSKQEDYSVYIQRAIFPKIIGPLGKVLIKKLLSNANKVYWDFDDNIIDSGEITVYERKIIEQDSNVIIVGNEYLKNRVSKIYRSKVKIIGTTDKHMEKICVNDLNVDRLKKYDKEIHLVWIGTRSNLKFIHEILEYLDEAALELKNKLNKKLILNVVCDQQLKSQVTHIIVNNIKWSRDIALDEMYKSHIGLMPLKEDYYTQGKCAFKAIQTLGCGLPNIVSPVGLNKEVIKNGYNGFIANSRDEWKNSILKLSEDKEMWLLLSINSRADWESRFNSNQVQKFIYNEILDKY